MFPRSLFAFCALLLVAAVASENINEEVEVPQVAFGELEINEGSVEERSPLLAAAIRILAQAFKWAARNCLKEAANNCKQHWKDPKELVKCGGHYLQANKGRCVVG